MEQVMKFLNTRLILTITLLQLLNPISSLSAMKKTCMKRKRISEQNEPKKETKKTSGQGLFANSYAQAASLANHLTNKVIEYSGVIHPKKMWFEGQSEREQERMVLESQPGSIAHKIFKQKNK